MEAKNNQPHIVWFQDVDDEDINQQFFIAVEQSLMLETNNLVSAIFACVAAHYVFNLSYNPKAGLFIQERICEIPSKGCKRHASTVSHFSGIARTYEEMFKDSNHETVDMH